MAIIPTSATTNTLIVTVSDKFESGGSNKNGPVLFKTSSVTVVTVGTCRLELSVTVISSVRTLGVDSESIVVLPTQNYGNTLTVIFIDNKNKLEIRNDFIFV